MRVGIISEWYSLLPANYYQLIIQNTFFIFSRIFMKYIVSVTFFFQQGKYVIIFRPYIEMNFEKLNRLHSIDFSMRISKMHGLPKKFRNPF